MYLARGQSGMRGDFGLADGRVVVMRRAFTLIELLIAMGIAFTVLAGLSFGYMQAYRINDSAMLQAAADRLVVDRMAMVRSAEWRHYGSQPTNRMLDFVGVTLTNLVVPSVSSVDVTAKVVTEVAAVPGLGTNVPIFQLRVACVWTGPNGFSYTNEQVTLRGPN